jgi:hypothetical protein
MSPIGVPSVLSVLSVVRVLFRSRTLILAEIEMQIGLAVERVFQEPLAAGGAEVVATGLPGRFIRCFQQPFLFILD